MDSWYVVQTQAHAEQRAKHHLENQDYEVYLPRYRKRRRHAGRTETVFPPLFPRYLFVRMDPLRRRWLEINSTFGVQKLICAGDQPLAVPEAIVSEIRAREDADGIVLLSPATMRRGQRVKILEGPFAELAGVFEEMADRDRAVLLLDILGRSVRVRLPRSVLSSHN